MRSLLAVTVAVVRRPRLWPAALRLARRTARRRWWRRPPFLPLPSADYIRFRVLTHGGDEAALPRGDEVVTFLEWCRDFERRRGPAAPSAPRE